MDISTGHQIKSKNLFYSTIRLNWCERHIIETCFPDLFFSDESTSYLDNPVGARWLRVRKTIYMQK